MKSLYPIVLVIASSIVLFSYGCKKCEAPVVTFESAAAIEKSPGELFSVNVIVTGNKTNISTISVSKTSGGAPKTSFMSVTDVGSKSKTITISDSVPKGMAFGSVITYTVNGISDCGNNPTHTAIFTVTAAPSATILDYLTYAVENGQAPRAYSRYSSDTSLNQAWDMIGRMARKFKDSNADKDIQDSTTLANPFNTNVRWGSRNGTKFVKGSPTFDWTNASAKSIVDAYKAGTPTDLVTFADNDYIFVNIKNSNRYAVVKIKTLFDTGGVSNDDYTFFAYKLAQ